MMWIFIFIFSTLSFGAFAERAELPISRIAEKQSELMTPALLELLQLTGIQHDGSLAVVIKETQKKWLRPAGKERWEIADVEPEKKKRIIELAKELGFVSEVEPKRKQYDYCVVLGATVERMQLRLDYVVKKWNEGVRFNQIIFLTGRRPLDPAIEAITDAYANESEAAHVMWSTTALPKELKTLPVTFVDVPMIDGESGVRRPTTGDTLISWLALRPKPGSCLFISNQPFCLYQHLTARTHLPKTFVVETVGMGGQVETQHGAVLLDSIARWLYQEALL